ncbi:MAG: SO_0444 family Cu/Zn efflux transporter [Candidatus Muiribacteriota bacterium]
MNYIEIIKNFLIEIWHILGEMSFSLIIGFIIAGILSEVIKADFIKKNLGKSTYWNIFKASLFGIPLPVCSCGIIPLASTLKKSGASNSSTVSFMISTPQTGVDSIAVTYSLLGPIYAVYRPVMAFFSGIFGGLLVHFFDKEDDKIEIVEECKSCCGDGHNHAHEHKESSNQNIIIKVLKYAFITLPEDIAGALIIGLSLSAVITLVIPEEFFLSLSGYNNYYAMILCLVAGIPIYVCSTSSIPIAASLILKGISPGAALVFLMAGPATSIATIATIFKVMGKKIFAFYLISIALTALISGVLMDLMFQRIFVDGVELNIHGDDNWLKFISAVIMVVMLIYPFFKKLIDKQNKVH